MKEFEQLYQFINGWVKAFHQSDVDGGGEITQEELNKLLSQLGNLISYLAKI